jgi:hypothetical protein
MTNGYHCFKISIQIIEKLQGNFTVTTMTIIFALSVAITTTYSQSCTKKTHKLLKKKLVHFFFV